MITKWTPAMDDIVREAYKNRTRLRDVADQLGVSRNAVIHRAFRLNLSKPISVVALELAQQPWRIAQIKQSGRRKSSLTETGEENV